MQETYLMIKPDGIEHKDAIFKRLKEEGLNIKSYQKIQIDMDIMKLLLEHYHEVIDEMKPEFNFVGKLFNSFYYGEYFIIPMHVTYEGDEDIITKTRTLIGATNPQDAEENTLRNEFSQDSYAIADKEERLVNNVIHASDSKESAQKELSIWKAFI